MFFDLVYVFCVGFGCFFSVFLFFRRGLSVRFLSLILMLLNYELLMQYLFRLYGDSGLIIPFIIRDSFLFLYGVLLYFYILAVTGKIIRIGWGSSIHFFPTLIVLAGGIFADNLFHDFFVIAENYLIRNRLFSLRGLFYFCVFVSASFYIVLSVIPVLRYRKLTEHSGAFETNLRRNWQFIFLCYSFSVLVFYALSTIMYLGHSKYSSIVSFSFCVYIYVPVFFSGYAVLLKDDHFSIFHKIRNREVLHFNDEENNSDVKYARNRLSEGVKEEYLARILHLLNVEKVYIDPELTMQSFALKTGIPLYHISQVVNLKLGVNYNTLINTRRINHAKAILADKLSMNKTVLEIAFESGFNSKTTFNNLFRAETGLTPTEFRRRAEKE